MNRTFLIVFEQRLGPLVHFLVIKVNGQYALQALIEWAAGRLGLRIIALTVAEVQRRGRRRVRVIGKGAGAYAAPLGRQIFAGLPYT